MQPSISIVTIVNNQDLYGFLKQSLAAENFNQEIQFLPIHADKQGWNAATALNHGLETVNSDWVICVHQDVLFPIGWLPRFCDRLLELPADAAVVGLVGRTRQGEFSGHILDPHGHTRWTPLPRQVVTVDEHLIAIRRQTGVRFDAENPGFHVYGADICLTAAAMNFGSYVIDCPVIHLSGGKVDPSFSHASDWLLNKWGKRTGQVIPTTCAMLHRPTLLNYFRRRLVRKNSKQAVHPRWRCQCNNVLCAEGVIDPRLVDRFPFLKSLVATRK